MYRGRHLLAWADGAGGLEGPFFYQALNDTVIPFERQGNEVVEEFWDCRVAHEAILDVPL